MRRALTFASIAIACLPVIGCEKSYDNQRAELESFVGSHKMGEHPDFWLVKHTMFGDLERVGLIFGFVDDQSFCHEIAALYMQRHPEDRYVCEQANR